MAGTERQEYIDDPTPMPEDWVIDGDPIYVDEEDEDLLEQRIREWVYVLRRVGGVVTSIADREEIAPGVFVNRGVGLKWDSYSPARRQEQPKENREQRRRRPRDRARDDRKQEQEDSSPAADQTDDDETGLEPDGGTVVDEVDPDNADVRDDYVNDPAKVLAGEA